MLKNHELYDLLKRNLKKNRLVKFKKKINYSNIINNYKLIFNCDYKSSFSKKYLKQSIKIIIVLLIQLLLIIKKY